MMDYRAWVIDIQVYKSALEVLRPICIENRVHIEEIPDFCLNLILHAVPWTGAEQEKGMCYNYTSDPFVKAKVGDLPACISKALFTHQKKAIEKILSRHGRMIVNDDLGTGKKIVALSAAIVYKAEWPLLIVCPQVQQMLWREEFVKWIPKFDVNKIQLVRGLQGEELRQNAAIFIVPYQALFQPQKHCFDVIDRKRFKVCIFDGATALKKRGMQHEEHIVSFLAGMKRILLLTGGSLTSNPIEIHNLLKIIRPDCIPDFIKFSNRFCDPL